jgi:uncharacterized protein (TIGR03067 family)
MQGKWDGQGATVTITGDRMVFSSDFAFKFTLEAKVNPNRIEGVGVVPRLDGKAFWGIYHLEKDKLTICWRRGLVGKSDWPVSFDPTQRDVWLMVFTRKKR